MNMLLKPILIQAIVVNAYIMCMDLISRKYRSCILNIHVRFLGGKGFKRNDAFSFFRKYR